jgi:hypothetical protein
MTIHLGSGINNCTSLSTAGHARLHSNLRRPGFPRPTPRREHLNEVAEETHLTTLTRTYNRTRDQILGTTSLAPQSDTIASAGSIRMGNYHPFDPLRFAAA